MKRFNLTTRLYLKVVVIVLILALVITAYSQWIMLQEEKAKYTAQLERTTAFILQKMPENPFAKITEEEGVTEKSLEDQVMAVNAVIQPILSEILIPDHLIKFSVYSRYHQRIVAVGPDFDKSLLVAIDPKKFNDIYETEMVRQGERNRSILCYGAPILYHIRPIIHNGQAIGHVFACINLDIINTGLWQKTLKSLLGGLVSLLILLMIIQETFIKLKKDLDLFAEAIIKGRAKYFESRIPELTPVLQYISEQTENMARLDRLNLIGEMAASIGHEVRNPMTTVRGFLQYMASKQTFNCFKDEIALMIEELDRANSIITEFLSLAKNKVMVFKEIKLNEVITEVVPLLQADALRYNCQIESKLETIPAIKADKNSMRQLIINMVRNGIEAMPQGGTITISTVCYDCQVLLSIKDNGIGVPPEIINKLGTPFFTTKENGTGLGLAVCYRIVQRHDGEISVESTSGLGTTFTITLPIVKNV